MSLVFFYANFSVNAQNRPLSSTEPHGVLGFYTYFGKVLFIKSTKYPLKGLSRSSGRKTSPQPPRLKTTSSRFGPSEIHVSTLPDAPVNRICISSPGQTRKTNVLSRDLKSWVKEKDAFQLVIPPCNWNEILNIRFALAAGDADQKYPLDALQECFNLWGGVPRTIIKNPKLLCNRENEELKTIRVKDAMRFLGTYDLDHDHLSGKLFHLYPDFLKSHEDNPSLVDKYDAMNAKYYWATKALETRAWARFGRQQEEEVLDFILTKTNDPASRGNAWEPYIHLLIESEGLKGTLRNLGSTDSEQLFSLKRGKVTFFKHFNEIDDSAQYWRPSVPKSSYLRRICP